MKTVAHIIRRNLRLNRLPTLSAAIIAVLLISPAIAASFRQLPNLPTIPPSVTFPAEREILKADHDRLSQRRVNVRKLQAEYNRDCADRLTANNSRRRHCSFRLQEIHRQSARLRRDIDALRMRFRTVEESALRRGHRAAGRPQKREAGSAVDARLKIIKEVLANGGKDWPVVLEQARAAAARAAGNPVLRDVAAYLDGIHSGAIAADMLENPYYKHGVRRWLAGDNWSAALSFARAARDNPGDDRVFASFATASGRQHASPACVMARRCISGNIATWVKRFGKSHEHAVNKILRRHLSGSGKDTDAALPIQNVLGAVTVFAAKVAPDENAEARLANMAKDVLAKLKRNNTQGALSGYIDIWRMLAPRRAGIFFAGYAAASGAPDVRRFLNQAGTDSKAGRQSDGDYLVKLRTALDGSREADPFSGALTQAQIIRLQR
jgi:hypothetical protein